MTSFTKFSKSFMKGGRNVETNMLNTVDEVATLLRLSHSVVYTHIKNGSIKAIKVGKYWRVPNTELQRIMKDGLVKLDVSKTV